jgi:hypothetical protein
VPEEGPAIFPPPTDRLHEAAARLADQLDEARLYEAAAYVSMAVDVIRRSVEEISTPGR